MSCTCKAVRTVDNLGFKIKYTKSKSSISKILKASKKFRMLKISTKLEELLKTYDPNPSDDIKKRINGLGM